jgi:hypothetical protein
MTHRTVARIGLGYLAANALLLGLWAAIAPRSFYDDFPGLGRAWVSVDGPYNEHLIRDVGALNLALVVLLIAAIVRLSKELVAIAGVAALAWGVPHLLYHALNAEQLSTGDNVLSLGGLALAAFYPLGLLYLAPRLDQS